MRTIAPLAPVALIVFCTMMYQASASNEPSNSQADTAGVNALVTANCRPQTPKSKIYDLVGIETHVAGGIIVRHPDRLRTVCAVVNRSLLNVSLRDIQTNRTMKDVGKERADNTELMSLASSLNMSKEEGTALVRAHGRQALADAELAKMSSNTVKASPSSTPFF